MRIDDVDVVVARGVRLVLETLLALGGRTRERALKREMLARGYHYKVYARNKRSLAGLGLITCTTEENDVIVAATQRGRDTLAEIRRIIDILAAKP